MVCFGSHGFYNRVRDFSCSVLFTFEQVVSISFRLFALLNSNKQMVKLTKAMLHYHRNLKEKVKSCEIVKEKNRNRIS